MKCNYKSCKHQKAKDACSACKRNYEDQYNPCIGSYAIINPVCGNISMGTGNVKTVRFTVSEQLELIEGARYKITLEE